MTMNRFALHNPTTIPEAVALLDTGVSQSQGAKLLSGGQDLLSEMKDRIVQPGLVVNLKHIPGLSNMSYSAGAGLTIGALVTIAEIAESAAVRKHFAALGMAAESVGSPQIRHAGTIGGNLCQRPRCWYYRNENVHCLKKGGDRCYAVTGENKFNAILGGGPSWIVHPSDTAPALVALGASITLQGRAGARTLPLEKFFALPNVNPQRENVLKPDEIVTRIHVPVSPPAARSVYVKFRERESMDWAMASAAVALEVSGGRIAEARLVLGGVAPIPWRVPKAEAALRGSAGDDHALQAAADAALDGALALERNGYKIALAKTILKRAIRQAMAA